MTLTYLVEEARVTTWDWIGRNGPSSFGATRVYRQIIASKHLHIVNIVRQRCLNILIGLCWLLGKERTHSCRAIDHLILILV